MNKKVIFFDIDGTLYDHDKKIPESTKRSVRLLKEKGHHLFIASGRSPFLIKPILEELGLDSFIAYNGQYVMYEGEVIYGNPLKLELMEQIYETADHHDHPLVFMGEKAMKASVPNHPFIHEGIGTLKTEHPEHDLSYFKENEIFQMLLFCKAEEEVQYEAFREEIDLVRWHELSTDVLPKGGSKAEGIKRVIERLPYEQKDTVAFGDGLNDREMISFAGTGVAMGNAVNELKDLADFVTKPVDEDGIFHAVTHLGLIEE
ncbi:Cof-type HAD-IIB family hydrolase [Bacillus sp. FSL W8-1143]|uniref:Cof-type HAD-IIB family hydrolase n=1 Tax=Bacillus TaxID=1386 RepID=UPI0020407892|nr:Cof-type HAD-IIB family hydrolase [Bacillus pumilus]MCM3149585.1 Cof-type HAD-IIB family hydrolase [Bacillus pumilus]MCP1530360.1 Cof subfamily protein (haloacid dehalogenase superfamily) [Bacillus pumilus]MDF9785753.1 Cof subfamily protein (haloacid dehalogenase superfamily) [Bacillus pumilus]